LVNNETNVETRQTSINRQLAIVGSMVGHEIR